MSLIDAAKELAEKGFHVFPLAPKSKVPSIDDFPNKATRDPKQIEMWWTDPILGLEQPFNVGISTTRFSDHESLVVVDVDDKDGKMGSEELKKLEALHGPLPLTFLQKTPSGGRHLVYRTRVPLKNSAGALARGIDIRSKGGYIVGAGSVLENGVYTSTEGAALAEAPTWLVNLIGEANVKSEIKAPIDVDAALAAKRAIEFLEVADPSIEGDGGNEHAYQVICKVKDFGVDRYSALGLLIDHWNTRCAPPWGVEELERLVHNAYQYGLNPVGAISPEADFKAVKAEAPEKSYLEKMNEIYGLVFIEGGHFIIHETVDEKGRPKRVFYTEQSFKRKMSPHKVDTGGKLQTQAHVWLDWKNRREYAGICFTPERTPKHGYYNLWRGFTATPVAPKDGTEEQRKGLQMFLDHAKENVCGNNEELFLWLMGYFAHLIQKPYERPLTTLVFKGSKGTGKNALVDRVGALLGSSHYITAHDSRYLTSHFNGHLDSCLMLVLDEAFWSGDKAAEGKLKGLTTQPVILIERKGKETYEVDNLVRLVVIGNEEWIVPASYDERRYAVFQMGEGKKQNRHYFHTMREILDIRGGRNLLLHYFKNFDLSKVDVNAAPKTDALLAQKTSSLGLIEEWWLTCLEEGHITYSDFGDSGWPSTTARDHLREAFYRYAKGRNSRSRLPGESLIGKALKNCAPSILSSRPQLEGKRRRIYAFPTLEQARAEFETFIGHKIAWEQNDD